MVIAPLSITLRGVPVELHPERGLFLPSEGALVVADLHWGKDAAFRASHIPIPSGTTADDLARLTRLLERTGASRLVVLGDLLHAKRGRHPELLHALDRWRDTHHAVAITLVRGNHDTHAGDPPESLGIGCHDAPWRLGPFVCAHEPHAIPGEYVLAGHLHPSVTIAGRGRERLRLPAFVFGPSVATLPAFTLFTGGGAYERAPADRLFAVTDEAVYPLA